MAIARLVARRGGVNHPGREIVIRQSKWILACALCASAALSGCATTSPQKAVAAPAVEAGPRWTTPTARPMPAEELLPRSVFFGNPDLKSVNLSPDGKYLSWLAPDEGVMNVWIAPASDLSKARSITRVRKRGIPAHFWSYDNRHILYLQDDAGDENWHVHAVDITTEVDRDLTPLPKVAAYVSAVSAKRPGEIVVGLNDRDPVWHDAWLLDLETGKRTLLAKNEHGFAQYVIDADYRVRYAVRPTSDAGNVIVSLDPETLAPKDTVLEIPHEDALTTRPLAFDAEGRTLYLFDSRGRDTSALVAMDTGTGAFTTIAEDARADLDDWTVDPVTLRPQAVGFNYLRQEWKVVDPALAADFEYLRTVAEGELEIRDRSLDDKVWIVSLNPDNGPVRYFRYDRTRKQADLLFSNRKALEGRTLARVHPVTISSRDGLKLVSYLTLPVATDPDGDGKPTQPVPMVLFVHGGPWARDTWGYDSLYQWLANRGYAVLSVNFRGSTGFGKEFVNASNREWGARMHDDLIDAVDWAIAEGIAEKDSVAIMGGSYGGYATLVGLTFTPERFACGVDIVGPSNLKTLLDTIPPYWKPMFEMLAKRVGDPRTEEGLELLQERSPLNRVARIQRPLLIGQGANDPRVKQAESDQIVKAMQDRDLPVTYVLYPDEGHGFARPENNRSFFAVSEAFLARCLGGPNEPVGEDFRGASIQVLAGADLLPGLAEALAAQPKGAEAAADAVP